MRDNIQLALFFTDGTIYNPTKISAKLIEKFSEIGDPILLPINTEAPEEANIPFIIFNQNLSFQIVSNFNSIVITVSDKFAKNIKEIIKNVFTIFEKEEVVFNRIGYVPSIFKNEEQKNKFKNEYMNSEIFDDTVEFQFSWLKRMQLGEVELNCWERNITDSVNFEGLLKCFDFNTIKGQDLVIDEKFANKFIDFCNNYIEERK